MGQYFTFNKKTIIGAIVFFLLLIAIPLTAYLVQKTQIFKSKANEKKLAEEVKKVEFAPGEVLVKFKAPGWDL